MWKNSEKPWGSKVHASTGGVEEEDGISTWLQKEKSSPHHSTHNPHLLWKIDLFIRTGC